MRYLYYKLWQDFSKSKTNDTPAFNAVICLSIIHTINILTVLVYFNSFLDIKHMFSFIEGYSFGSILLCLSVFTLNYFFLYKKRYAIAGKYQKENKLMKTAGTIFVYLYIISSFVLIYFISKRFPVFC